MSGTAGPPVRIRVSCLAALPDVDSRAVLAWYCDQFVLPLPDHHRFPMEKYRLLRERVASDGRIQLEIPEAATNHDLTRVHTAEYVARVTSGGLARDEIRRIGFPWSLELVERSRRSTGGTIHAAERAHRDGISVNLAGGTHHAFADGGEGFCVFNDVAVAVRSLQSRGIVDRCAVLDLDVHQGNGTAAIFRGDDSVFTLSVHGASNYPFRKETSDLDIGLDDGAGDDVFLSAVHEGVRRALGAGVDLAFYIAGADPFEGDRLGRLAVSMNGLRERDRVVFDACEQAGTPVAVVMSGGYAEDVHDTVEIHATTVLEAARRASSSASTNL
ncbi:MAG: histone deacetylase [Longimicrobiales bacterium]|nr:histone deacetylase [Longimicrobiales bacterium]